MKLAGALRNNRLRLFVRHSEHGRGINDLLGSSENFSKRKDLSAINIIDSFSHGCSQQKEKKARRNHEQTEEARKKKKENQGEQE
jgi:hypothetical protein